MAEGKRKRDVLKRSLLAVGDRKTGRVRLLLSFSRGRFIDAPNPVWSEPCVVDVMVDETCVELSLSYRPTGEDRDYSKVLPLVYSNTDVVLICFSVDNSDSLQSVESHWVPEIKRYCPNAPYLVVATKADLRNNPTAIEQSGKVLVTSEEGREVAEKVGAWGYFECSALRDTGMLDVFTNATRAVLAQQGAGSKVSKMKDALSRQVDKLRSAVHINKSAAQ